MSIFFDSVSWISSHRHAREKTNDIVRLFKTKFEFFISNIVNYNDIIQIAGISNILFRDFL